MGWVFEQNCELYQGFEILRVHEWIGRSDFIDWSLIPTTSTHPNHHHGCHHHRPESVRGGVGLPQTTPPLLYSCSRLYTYSRVSAGESVVL